MKIDDKHLADLHNRFDKLEEKLDRFTEQTVENRRDLDWLKGSVKIGVSAMVSLAIAVITNLIHTFTGKN